MGGPVIYAVFCCDLMDIVVRSKLKKVYFSMAVLTPSRPDLLAYREATTLEFPKLVTELSGILGRKLTAYIASVTDARAVDRWIAGSEAYKGVEERLRLAYRLAKMISDHDGQRVVQAWF